MEALVENICKDILDFSPKIMEVVVKVRKPQAPVPGIFDYFEVEIRRKDENSLFRLGFQYKSSGRIFILCLKALKDNPQIEITKNLLSMKLSHRIFGTGSFLNMVIKLETQLEPLNLLSFCQEVRENLHEKGPSIGSSDY